MSEHQPAREAAGHRPITAPEFDAVCQIGHAIRPLTWESRVRVLETVLAWARNRWPTVVEAPPP